MARNCGLLVLWFVAWLIKGCLTQRSGFREEWENEMTTHAVRNVASSKQTKTSSTKAHSKSSKKALSPSAPTFPTSPVSTPTSPTSPGSGVCDCDDMDPCTIDSCEDDGVCVNEIIDCGLDQACDSFTGLCEDTQNIVPCVAVIDEWDNRVYNSEWATFRGAFSRRPFCLLVPNSGIQTLPNGFDADTLSPDGLDRTIVQTVNRDQGNTAQVSDWFQTCQLDRLSPNSLQFIGLFVDTSGSMNLDTVRASYNKFLVDVEDANLTIAEVFNGAEQWIDPFITTLVPTA